MNMLAQYMSEMTNINSVLGIIRKEIETKMASMIIPLYKAMKCPCLK